MLELNLMRMNRIFFCLLCCLFYNLQGWSQEGKSSYDFLNLPVSTHVNALGGNNISIIEEDVAVTNQNPALLGPEMDLQLNLNYMRYVAGINIAGFTFAKAAGDRGAWAAGLQYLGYGEMKLTEPDGSITGKFNPKDIIFNGIYSHDLNDRWRGGINAKLVYSQYEQYSALALCVDLGVNYYNPEKDLSMSILVKNAGGQLKRFNDKFERMPWDIQLGLSKTLDHAPFRFSVTAQHLTRWKLPYTYLDSNLNNNEGDLKEKNNFASNLFRHLIFAVDYIPSQNLYIAIGYNYKTRTDMKSYNRNFLSGFTAGAGIKVRMFSIGASVAQHHKGGTSFMFNLNTNLNDLLGSR
ncbi:type IX secretion system protein PorQ [Coprobacter tertius]|uniref:Type IX secretion system protein PorQ n=1 Tax=Coprobacter tertius TaxID=2944915 RepID=A0ABT1MG30_9BACT|nr:type IX secretion system protein PorQ [Coprobacter tertius]MCP9611592.1 type IX secretion system protein PorQ [Coprobacter tertius]